MLTPQGPLGGEGAKNGGQGPVPKASPPYPKDLTISFPNFQLFYPETPELEELTGGPVPATAARKKKAKGNVKSLPQPPFYPTYSSPTPSPINIPWSHQHPRLPGIPTGMIQGGL